MLDVKEKIVIREATFFDVAGIKRLIEKFYQESICEYGLSLDESSIRNTIKTFITSHIVLVLEKEKRITGVIAGTVLPSIFDDKQKVAQEAIWYIAKPERTGSAGVRLIKAFKEACKQRGVTMMIMVSLSNSYNRQLMRFYKMNKYKLIENHFIKEV